MHPLNTMSATLSAGSFIFGVCNSLKIWYEDRWGVNDKGTNEENGSEDERGPLSQNRNSSENP